MEPVAQVADKLAVLVVGKLVEPVVGKPAVLVVDTLVEPVVDKLAEAVAQRKPAEFDKLAELVAKFAFASVERAELAFGKPESLVSELASDRLAELEPEQLVLELRSSTEQFVVEAQLH